MLTRITLYLVGLALSIAQFVMIRDFVSILYGEEIVIVLVTASFFVGLSAGYLLSLRLSDQVFRALLVISVFLHLSFPFSYRYLASWFAAIEVSGYLYLWLLFIYALLFNAAFATFLPRLVSDAAGASAAGGVTEEQRLKVFYGLELAGFMSGFLIVAASWSRPLVDLMTAYWVAIGVIVWLTLRRWSVTAVYIVAAAVVVYWFPTLDYHSTALLYEKKHGLGEAEVLFSVNSPYQRVEVIETPDGDRRLYLDGLLNLNSSDLSSLNFYIAEVPARLMNPERTLIIGNGTLSSVPKVHQYTRELTSVELDGGVLKAGQQFYTTAEDLKGIENWSLHTDDGKHFLLTSKEQFDLVVVDVPSPLTIQEAYLHSKEFYGLVARRLGPNGVVAVQLSGPLQRNDRTPARVTKALRAAFPEVMAIYSERADRGFAYASKSLPFSVADVQGIAKGYEKGGDFEVVGPETIDSYLDETVALSVNSMDLVLRRGWERFTERYFR